MVGDRAGNSIRHARNAGFLGSRLKTFKDQIGGIDTSDYYRIRIKTRSSVTLVLKNLRANAEVALLNQRGRSIGRSTRPGRLAEAIRQPLDAGVYFVRVFPKKSNQNTYYRLVLKASAISASPEPPTSVPPSSLTEGRFNIEFDYRYDTNGWFTPEKKATLEAAAAVWERIIQDDFADIPTGTQVSLFRNPQTGQAVNLFTNDRPIDDLLIFPGARELGGIAGATLALSGPAVGLQGQTRYSGSDFEPWIGTMAFDTTTNWFFDSTPGTRDDIPLGTYDFFSIAAHEIAHVLGFGTSDAFDSLVNGFTFTGPNARANNGGNPIPLQNDRGHIQEDYRFGGFGEPLMSPRFARQERRSPTALDAAILDDIGYDIDYGATFSN